MTSSTIAFSAVDKSYAPPQPDACSVWKAGTQKSELTLAVERVANGEIGYVSVPLNSVNHRKVRQAVNARVCSANKRGFPIKLRSYYADNKSRVIVAPAV